MRTLFGTGLFICWLLGAFASASTWSTDGRYISSALPTAVESRGRHSDQTRPPLTAAEALDSLTFSTEQFAASTRLSTDIYWHKLRFPAQPEASQHILDISNYMLDELDVFVFHDGKLHRQWRRGDRQPWSPWDGRYAGIWFPIQHPANVELDVLIRKSSTGPMLLPLRIFEPAAHIEQVASRYKVWAMAVGALMILLLHNTVVFLLSRYPAYGYYLIFHVAVLLSLGVTQGFGPWFLPMAINQWMAQHILSLYTMAAWSIFQFSLHFLQLRTRLPHWWKRRRHIELLFLLALLASIVLPERLYATPYALIQVGLSVLSIYWGIQVRRQGFAPAGLYLLSWSVFLLGAFVGNATFRTLLPFNTLTEYALLVCTLLQLLGFTFSLAIRARHLEQENNVRTLTNPQSGLPNRQFFLRYVAKSPWSSELPNNASGPTMVLIQLVSLHDLSTAVGPARSAQVTGLLAQRLDHALSHEPSVIPHTLPNQRVARVIDMAEDQWIFLLHPSVSLDKVLYRLEPQLNEPIQVDGSEFQQMFAMGVAKPLAQDQDMVSLFQKAQMAADENGTASALWSEYQTGWVEQQQDQLYLVVELTQAIRHRRFEFVVQPKVDLSSMAIHSGEVLLRWHHPEKGSIGPDVFIPLAERVGLIFKLTQVVLNLTFEWVALHRAALKSCSLAINISARDLLQPAFAQDTLALCQKYQLEPARFILEITETTALSDKAMAIENADLLRAAGFSLSIDDFGAGYSSMQNIHRLAPQEIKIDRQFVRELTINSTHETLCRSLITLSQDLHTCATAEGIETAEQLALLKQWGCHSGQGYYLYRPLAPDDFLTLLRTQQNGH